MKNTNTYTINHEKKTITITREFAKRSGVINSEEYNLFMQFRKDLPDYKILKRTATKNTDKKTHKGLSIPFMEKCLAAMDNAADAKAEFKRVKEFYTGHPAYYSKVRAWFLDKYPNYDIYAPTPTQDMEEAANENAAPIQNDNVPLDLTA